MLTLVIITDDGERIEDAIEAANDASREHPCRVIVLARGANARPPPRLDAQIRVGGDAGRERGRSCCAATAPLADRAAPAW